MKFDAVLFVEPETWQGRALSELFKRTGITALSADTTASARDTLFTTWRTHGNSAATAKAAQNVIDTLTGGVDQSSSRINEFSRPVALCDRTRRGSNRSPMRHGMMAAQGGPRIAFTQLVPLNRRLEAYKYRSRHDTPTGGR